MLSECSCIHGVLVLVHVLLRNWDLSGHLNITHIGDHGVLGELLLLLLLSLLLLLHLLLHLLSGHVIDLSICRQWEWDVLREVSLHVCLDMR
jgi:hypothetical protein